MAFQEPLLTACDAVARRDLKSTPLAHLIEQRPRLVYGTSDMTINQLCELLRERNLISVPIYDKSQQRFLGLTHIFSCISYLMLALVKKSASNEPLSDQFASLMQEQASITVGEALFAKEVKGGECETCFSTTDSLEQIVPPLRRVPHYVLAELSDKAGQPVEERYRMISQTDVVRFLCSHVEELDPQLQEVLLTPVNELGLVEGRIVYSIGLETKPTALDAYLMMASRNVPALPVSLLTFPLYINSFWLAKKKHKVCEGGVLRYNISASDLRGVTPSSANMLSLPVGKFLRQAHNKKLNFPVTCPPTMTVKEVLDNLLTAKAHRVYAIDKDMHPLSVISFTDILCHFFTCWRCFPCRKVNLKCRTFNSNKPMQGPSNTRKTRCCHSTAFDCLKYFPYSLIVFGQGWLLSLMTWASRRAIPATARRDDTDAIACLSEDCVLATQIHDAPVGSTH